MVDKGLFRKVEDIKPWRSEVFNHVVPAPTSMGLCDLKLEIDGEQLWTASLDATVKKYPI